MKLRILTVPALALIGAVLLGTSCIRENDYSNGQEEGTLVTISFNPVMGQMPAATRAGYHDPGGDELTPGNGVSGSDAVGTEADRDISHMRVLVYKSSTGELSKNLFFEITESTVIPITAEVLTGTYDFYFIANSDQDTALDAILSDDNAVKHRTKLDALSFARSDYDAGKDIPMVEVVRGVEVKGDNLLHLPDSSSDMSGTWLLEMTRTGVRLSLEITLSPTQYDVWSPQEITIGKIASKVFVLPEQDNDTPRYATALTLTADPDDIEDILAADGETVTGKIVRFDRIILPELLFAAADADAAKAKAMTLTMDVFGDKTGAIGQSSSDYTLPRNTWVHLDVTVEYNTLDVVPTVKPWNTEVLKDVLFDGKYTLRVDRSGLTYLPASGGKQTLRVYTDYPGDGEDYEPGWTATFENGDPDWIVFDNMEGDENVTTPIEGTTTKANFASSAKTHRLVITAGPNLRKTIDLRQLGTAVTPPPVGIIPYVGAFWKASQTGERLIRIPRQTTGTTSVIDGGWSATVIEGKEWIRLDKSMTSDPNVGWRDGASEASVVSGNDAGFENRYPVHSDETYVEGTVTSETPHGIYFRIGLTGTIAATEHRYGVVLLSYAGGAYTQRLFIRQGEDPDYLMHGEDPDAGGTHTRGTTVKWSPYNLTSGAMTDGVQYVPGVTSATSSMTGYPSQAGAFWQFSAPSPYTGYAYSPVSPTGAITDWNTSAPDWTAAQETCPVGYRRPASGSTRTSSEMARSLMTDLSGSVSNSAWGYYADGFFDRRKIEKQTSTPVATTIGDHTAVAKGTSGVAYIGRLFWNPATNGSLFFPASGARAHDDGNLDNAGAHGHYWSSTGVSNGTHAYNFGVSAINPTPNATYERTRGYAIRCVKVPEEALPDLAEDSRRITWKDGRYALTQERKDAGLYFKFGSVVGLYSYIGGLKDLSIPPVSSDNDEDFQTTDIPWDLTDIAETGETDEDAYELVPYVDTYTNIDAAFHTVANVREGRGDPCRLVGLDLSKIKNAVNDSDLTVADIDNGTWRLPTAQENEDWAGWAENNYDYSYTEHWWNRNQTGNISGGIPGAELPRRNSEKGRFLPAAGFRSEEGELRGHGALGHYWTSVPYNDVSTSLDFGFGPAFFAPSDNSYREYAFGVRCVRQSPAMTVDALSAYYMLDGREITVGFNTNASWTAVIEDSQGIIAAAGSELSGGAGVGALTFTLIADNSNVQKADRDFKITFTGTFGTKTVTVTGRTPYLKLDQHHKDVPGILPASFDITISSNIPGLAGVTASVADNAGGVITGTSIAGGGSLRTDVTVAQTAARTGSVKISWSSGSLLLEDAASVSRSATSSSFTYVDELWLSDWITVTAGKIANNTTGTTAVYDCPEGSSIWTELESTNAARLEGSPSPSKAMAGTYAISTILPIVGTWPVQYYVSVHNYWESSALSGAGLELFNVVIPQNDSFRPNGPLLAPVLPDDWGLISYRCVARQ